MNPADCGVRVTAGRTVRLLAPLRGFGIALLAALLLALTAGCGHRKQVSRRSYPPPPSVSYPAPRSTAGSNRVPRPAAPRPDDGPRIDDNAVPGSAVETGLASWYAPSGRRAANGEVYDGNSLTAAHRTWPLGTTVRVTNLATNQSVVVRITDRGPFVRGRVLDLSTAAAKATGVYRMGVARVRMEVLEAGPGSSPAGRWCVQIGAFADGENADRLKTELVRQYTTTAKVIAFQGATGMWVRVNPVPGERSRAVAIARSVRVAEPDAQAYVVRLD